MAGNKDIAGDFNKTASRFLAREVPTPLLLAKYGLMLKFEAKTPEDKGELVSIMCDTALKALDARANPRYTGYLGNSDLDSLGTVLKTLENADSAPMLPTAAPAALAETGMKFIARAETESSAIDAAKLTDYARLCLDHAEKMQALIDRRNEDVSLAKNITPARRIVLKKDDAP